MRIPKEKRKKLSAQSKPMMFLGYEEMGYKFIDPVSKKLTVARDAIFYELKHVMVR